MKQYLKLMTKSLMLLVIIVSTASTGFLSTLNPDLDFVDTAQEASAQCNGGGGAISPQQCIDSGGAWEQPGMTYGCIGGSPYLNTSYPETCASAGGYWGVIGSPEPTPSQPTTVYPTSCPSGTSGVGTPGTSSFYCQKTVTQNVNKYPTSCPSGYTGYGTPGTSSFVCNQACTKVPASTTFQVNGTSAIYKVTKDTITMVSEPTQDFHTYERGEWTHHFLGVGPKGKVPRTENLVDASYDQWGNYTTPKHDAVYEGLLLRDKVDFKYNGAWVNYHEVTIKQGTKHDMTNLKTGDLVTHYILVKKYEDRHYTEGWGDVAVTVLDKVAEGCVGSGTTITETKYVKQTEYQKPSFVKDFDLGDVLNDFGTTGERADGQFDADKGSHSNGWYLNGAGESYKSNHVQFNNIPDNGYVNAIGDSWQPQFTISQGKTNLDVPREQSKSLTDQQWNTALSTYKGSGVTTELLAYRIDDLEAFKTIQNSSTGLTDLFTKSGTDYKYQSNIVSTTVDSTGIKDYDKLKVNKSGYYVLASKYIDLPSAKKEMTSPSQAVLTKHTYYSFIPVNINFMADLGYLPIQNNLLAQINENMLTVGNKKGNHKLSNLSYQTYKSMKVPSAYNTGTNKTAIGSTTGGIQLLDKDLKAIAITGDSALITNAKVSDILEYDKGFYIATDKGVLHLNCADNKLTTTSVTEPINDLDMYNNSLYLITDTTLYQYFIAEDKMVKSNNEYDLKSMYNNPTSKAGQVQIVGDLMTVSTKDEGSGSEILILTK
ncbi:MAG: hypothetical protein ABS904_00960 [Solibacillus isronensis]